MDEEDLKLVKQTLRLAKENNKMLRQIRGAQKREHLFKILKWIIIISLGVGTFYFIQPYIDLVKQVSIDVTESVESIKNIKNIIPGI